jgi:hypothetical protein
VLTNVATLSSATPGMMKRRISGPGTQDASPQNILDLGAWAAARGIGAVIWIDLPPQFDKKIGVRPTDDQVITYLKGIAGRVLDEAERYVRFAPPQIDTNLRRRIEAELGWTPQLPPSGGEPVRKFGGVGSSTEGSAYPYAPKG